MRQGSLLQFFQPKEQQKTKRSDFQQNKQDKPKDPKDQFKVKPENLKEQIKSSQKLQSQKKNNEKEEEKKEQQLTQQQLQKSQQLQQEKKRLENRMKLKKLQVNSSSESEDDYEPESSNVMMDEDELEQEMQKNQSRFNKKPQKKNKMEVESSNDEYTDDEIIPKKKQSKISFAPKTVQKSKPSNVTNTNTKAKQSSLSNIINVDQENNLSDANGLDDLEDRTPYWATKEKLRDANKKKPGEQGYDPTTLYVPPDELKKLTATKKQFWEVKSKNFDKIIFFKLGKFYELFYDDALITNKYLDLNWMGKKMHTGFPEKCLEKYACKLVEMGYKIAVVEQMETPKQMEERVKQEKKKGKTVSKVVKRDICQVFTKGTFSSEEELTYQPRYLLSFRSHGNNFGISILESNTNTITLGYIEDDENSSFFKTMLYQVKPQEVVYDPDNVSRDIQQILKSGYVKPVLSILGNKNGVWHQGVAYNKLEIRHGNMDEKKWPTNLQYYVDKEESRNHVFSALSGLFTYLDNLLLVENVVETARYQVYDPIRGVSNTMVMDSQCLQHLEILEGSLNPKDAREGSLLHFVDKTVSAFGKRLMKNWVCAPLRDIKRINDRYDAIEDLHANVNSRDKFRERLKKIPDLDRLCAKAFKYSVKNQKQDQAIMFEDISASRLRSFKDLLQNIKKSYNLLQDTLVSDLGEYRSTRLIQLLSQQPEQKNNQMETEEQNEEEIQDKKENIFLDEETNNFIFAQGQSKNPEIGLLPDILSYVSEFENYIEWKKDVPHPVQGIIPAYDEINEKTKNIEKEFEQYLKKIQTQFQDRTIQFDHSKFRYQIEIKEDKVKGKKKPANFEFTSSKKGYQRFHTPEIKELLEQLDEAEEEQKSQLSVFAQFVFKQFADNYKIWDQLIQILAELDCLCSLSLTSFYAEGVMSRPQLEYSGDGYPYCKIKDGRHPCVQSQGVTFIPNDVILGIDENKDKNLMLITGPNMGGKSTTLRMSCIISILAQIGCYVPAQSCQMTIVDRIFTRIGASDRLIEGKSTFYIEMEETLNAVKYGTKDSLVIMDELGRGTSTYDGVAIAYSILKNIVEKVQCRCLFATHYHILLEEFENSPNVCFYYMSCHVDEKHEKVIFLYKLKPGSCHSSFGINVAKVVGIDSSIIETAKSKAKEFEDDLQIQKNQAITQQFQEIMNILQQDNNTQASSKVSQLVDIFSNNFQIKTPKK